MKSIPLPTKKSEDRIYSRHSTKSHNSADTIKSLENKTAHSPESSSEHNLELCFSTEPSQSSVSSVSGRKSGHLKISNVSSLNVTADSPGPTKNTEAEDKIRLELKKKQLKNLAQALSPKIPTKTIRQLKNKRKHSQDPDRSRSRSRELTPLSDIDLDIHTHTNTHTNYTTTQPDDHPPTDIPLKTHITHAKITKSASEIYGTTSPDSRDSSDIEITREKRSKSHVMQHTFLINSLAHKKKSKSMSSSSHFKHFTGSSHNSSSYHQFQRSKSLSTGSTSISSNSLESKSSSTRSSDNHKLEPDGSFKSKTDSSLLGLLFFRNFG